MELPEEIETNMNLYSQFPKLNYEIAGDKGSSKSKDERINHLAPDDYKLLNPEKLKTNNYAFFYSPTKNEIVLSIKGTTQRAEWINENLNSIAYHVFSPDKKFIPHQDLNRKGLLVDVARKYNRLKTIEEKNKFIESSQSRMHDVILDLTEVLYEFIEKNKLDLLKKEDRPKLIVTGHSLGSSRGMGLLEAMRTIDFKNKGDPNEPNIYLKPYKIPNLFDVEAHFFNSAPYPSDERGDFYFLNDFVQKDPDTNDIIIHEPIKVTHYSTSGFIKDIGDVVSGLHNPKIVQRRNRISRKEQIYKTDLNSYDMDVLMTTILLKEQQEEQKVFKQKKKLIISTNQSLKEYCKINKYDPICAFVKY